MNWLREFYDLRHWHDAEERACSIHVRFSAESGHGEVAEAFQRCAISSHSSRPADCVSADYWRERAREARARSFARRDVEGRRALLQIAENYEQLAEQAEAIDKAKMSVPL